ncbi:MAG: DUF1015 domain-containing protein [Bacteroidetes bacterium]|nr:DUF1015 domain-containing protein [Bacteroidota bacterium]MBS1974935.1 DUF1015 domain-containing protein [Bacteroidota bacterium]
MAVIKPFKALRPIKELASKIASRPYDVLSSEEARVEATGNPLSFLHITKSEIDLPAEIDIHSQQVYDTAKKNLGAFQQKGSLFKEESPCYYIYQLDMNGRSQTGLVCVSSIDDYENGIIKKHELTRPDKELDRINHIKTTGAQTGNVFLTYKTNDRLNKEIEDWKASHHPEYDFVADDKVKHIIWLVNDEGTIERISSYFAETVPFTYIADGHHRAASAAKVRKALISNACEESNYFLTTLFPASQLSILDYNRVVKDLNGLSTEVFLHNLENDFFVGKMESAFVPSQFHEFGMYLDGNWFKLIAKEGTYENDPIGVLDVSILQKNVLDKILAIKDVRTDKRIDFVGGIRGTAELEKRVDSGEMKAAFSLCPVSMQQLMDIADSGNIMPPKSTWFEPKLRDGLLTHLIA